MSEQVLECIGRFELQATLPRPDAVVFVSRPDSGFKDERFVDGKDCNVSVAIRLFRHAGDARDGIEKVIEALERIGLVRGC